MEISGAAWMKIKLKGSELLAILFPQEYGRSSGARATVLRKHGINESGIRNIKRALRTGRWRIL